MNWGKDQITISMFDYYLAVVVCFDQSFGSWSVGHVYAKLVQRLSRESCYFLSRESCYFLSST